MAELSDLIFISFNKHVVALDRHTGHIVWSWKSPRGMGYATTALNGDQLIVCVMGYTYSLDPHTGRVRWENELPGLGSGVACITSVYGSTNLQRAAQYVQNQSDSSS